MEMRALLSAMWRSRTGPFLVAAQVAITLAVVVNVGYVVQLRLQNVAEPTGLDVSNIFWVVSQSYTPEYNHAVTVQADLNYLQSLPGVIAAATTSNIPQNFGMSSLAFAADPMVLEKGGGVPSIIYFGSEKFVQALGVKLIAGRAFDAAAVRPPATDGREMFGNWSSEVVITKNLADKLFPKGDALGKTLHAGLVNKPATIVGIIELVQHQPVMGRAAELFRTAVMLPAITPSPNTAYLVRTQPGRRDATMARVEKEMADMQPGRYLASMEALATTVDRQRLGARSSIVTLGIVAVFVLGVTMVGIVGLAAFTVAARTKQLGTRRAIGATKLQILRYFLVENWIITSAGALVGCALALVVGIKLSEIYTMPRLPLFYLLGGVAALWIVGQLSVLIPARRGASISPATATRTV
jgi:putative ABC transport system permease protein